MEWTGSASALACVQRVSPASAWHLTVR